MALFYILLFIQIALRAAIAVALTVVFTRQPGKRNLRWLAIVFYVNAVVAIFVTDLLPSGLIYFSGMLIAQIALVMFIHQTFYQGRRSPYLLFMGLAVVANLAAIVMALTGGNIKLAQFLNAIQVGVNWVWHALIGYRAYKVVAQEAYVEDWIKARYKMMIAYSLALVVTQASLTVDAFFQGNEATIFRIVAVIFAIASVILQFLVWVLPEKFRLWLNRNYRAPQHMEGEELFTEEELRKLRRG